MLSNVCPKCRTDLDGVDSNEVALDILFGKYHYGTMSENFLDMQSADKCDACQTPLTEILAERR